MAYVKFKFHDKPTKERLLKAIGMGATYVLACNYAGISPVTFNTWMRRGEENLNNENSVIDEYVEFYDQVKKAEGKASMGWLTQIEKAARDGNWQAAAWKLERRYPNEYGRFTPEKPEQKNQNNEDTIEERVARVVSIIDDARKRKANSRSRNNSRSGDDA